MESNDISIYEVFLRIKKRIIMVIIIVLLSVLIPLGTNMLINKSIYEAKIALILDIPDETNENIVIDSSMYDKLIGTYIRIATTNTVAEMAANSLEDVTASELMNSVSAFPEPSAMIINITAQNKDPEKAYKVLQAYTKAFIERSEVLIPEGNLNIIDDGGKPLVPLENRMTSDITVGLIIGIVVSVSLAFILEELEIKMKNKNEAKKH